MIMYIYPQPDILHVFEIWIPGDFCGYFKLSKILLILKYKSQLT